MIFNIRQNHSDVRPLSWGKKKQNNIAKVWISDELFRILNDTFFFAQT